MATLVNDKGLFVADVAADVVAEVAAWVAGEEHAAHQWAEDGRPGRSTLNYGWDFPMLEQGVKKWNAMPECMKKLQNELYRLYKDVSVDAEGGVLTEPAALDNIIVTFYREGQSIVPHYDRAESPHKAYCFGESVFGVVLVADAVGNIFWQENDTVPGQSLTMDMIAPDVLPKEHPGMSFMMQRDMRHWPWYHGVVPVQSRRVSVTARVTRFTKPMKTSDDHPGCPEPMTRPA
eukprot:TRINITY_DN33770_c0_g1_i1.p1 TRINITY_DN33770_c0_g1~~TRINITY_DN33770_c0_g1_i1.p1  ORF type:complete len:233 (+),score=73.21 TRINITY_DN33770_c0_g1_i1:34-732(+)